MIAVPGEMPMSPVIEVCSPPNVIADSACSTKFLHVRKSTANALVGCDVGSDVGCAVGIAVGATVGASEGTKVGDNVG